MNTMKPQKSFSHKTVAAIPLLAGLAFSPLSSASLVNADFSDGFNGWQGEVLVYDYTSFSESSEFGTIFDDYTDNFTINGNSATLTTSATQELDIFGILLTQTFDIPTITEGNSLFFSLDVNANPTDYDLWGVELSNEGEWLDLNVGGTFDITEWAGETSTLSFSIQDMDFNLGDSLTVGNFLFEEVLADSANPSDIPEPTSALLLALGLAGLYRARRTSK